MKILEAFKGYFDLAIAGLPAVIMGLVLLFVGWLIIKAVTGLIGRSLRMAGLDAGSERVGVKRTLEGLGIQTPMSKILAKVLYWVLMLILVLVAAEVLNIAPLSAGLMALIAYLPKLFTALTIVIVGAIIADRIKEAVATLTKSIGLEGGRVIAKALYVILLLFTVITALNVAGVDTSLITSNIVIVIAAVLLAFSVAYGFASREILTNILSSYYGKDRFRPGQLIKIGDDEGVVEKVDSIAITIKSGDKRIVIPCRQLISERIELLGEVEAGNE